MKALTCVPALVLAAHANAQLFPIPVVLAPDSNSDRILTFHLDNGELRFNGIKDIAATVDFITKSASNDVIHVSVSTVQLVITGTTVKPVIADTASDLVRPAVAAQTVAVA